jgi:hypothetical protein
MRLTAILIGVLTCFGMSQAHAQALTVSNDASFGTTNANPTVTSPNSMLLGTNGTISYPSTASGPGSGTPGALVISGFNAGDNIKVDCEATKTLTDNTASNGSTTLSMTEFRFVVGTSVLGPGLGTKCNGLGGNALSYNFVANNAAANTIHFGGAMDVTHPKFAGTYTLSSNAGGKITFQIKKGATTVSATADVSASFASQAAITSTTNMDYGKIMYTTPVNSSSHADIGTDGGLVFAGNFSSATGSTTGTAGQVTISNVQNGVTLEVYCDSTATLTNGAGASIKVTGLKVSPEGSTGPYASTGSACNGSGGTLATTMVYNGTTGDQFFFGGKLDGGTATNFTGGNYSTSNSGGASAQVVIISQ